jgi:hypothetical protein
MPGAKWREQILHEMNRTDLAVFFVSPASVGRPWLNFELGYIEKSSGIPMIFVAINNPELSKSGAPVAAHQVIPLSAVPKMAGEGLLRFIRTHIPAEKSNIKKTNAIQIESKTFPVERGWQRYVYGGKNEYAGRNEIKITAFGFAFGRTFDDDGFRYPASQDSLHAPWQFLVINANPDVAVNVYFVMEMSNGCFNKLYANCKQDSVGFGNPNDEFQIPIPKNNRPELLLINTQSFVPRFGVEPRAIKGLRVRGPTELANIGMFESRASVPGRFKRGAMEITLP